MSCLVFVDPLSCCKDFVAVDTTEVFVLRGGQPVKLYRSNLLYHKFWKIRIYKKMHFYFVKFLFVKTLRRVAVEVGRGVQQLTR